ncbi:MAG TPA: hypothetical protein VF915_06010, partial [Reyranella sp.]
MLPLQGAPAPQVSLKVAPGEFDLSKGPLAIPADVVESVRDGGELDVKVRLPGLAQGELKLHRRGEHFSSIREQGILLTHPALGRFSTATPTLLVLRVADEMVTGWVGLGTPGPAKGGKRSLLDAMAKGGDLLGWAGLSGIRVPTFHNEFANGVIDVRAEKLAFRVGGFLDGAASAALDNKALSFDGSAKIQIPGGNSGELQIRKDPAGTLAGRLDLAVNIGSVAGNVTATLVQGFVSILGSVAYNGDRMSGKVTLVATDEATARDITLKKPEAGADVPIELPGPDRPVKPGKRAFCGWGQLTFRVTDWLAGTATVIVNSKGQATVIGEIAPPKEFILFEQKEWIKQIFKVEIRAGYGIPVVGQVALFANISLAAIAKVGPGKLYSIKLKGAYSTDPRVAKQLSIEGTLNISAFAGLRLRAEAGLVVTIIAHDIKAGVGLNAIAGVRGYVEATPRIGMRELQPGKRQYYIQGHLEIAAQPVLGFSGDLFVEIETPWWSPLSDKRWTWPLFSIEYPLPGEFGIGADVDYVLGSKQWPKIEFGEVNFDSSKFLTDVMNDNADSGRGGEEKKQGDWKEGVGGGGPGGAKNKGGAGKKPGEPGYDSEPVGDKLSFSGENESHELWFEEKPGAASLMVASTKETLPARLQKLRGQIESLLEGDRPKATSLINKAEKLLPEITDEARQVAIMKEAERQAQETYKKHGKDKKKSKGKKPSRREKNKKLKADESKLKDVLKDLFVLMRQVTWKNLEKPAIWSSNLREKTISGRQKCEIVGGEKTARMRTANSPGVDAIAAVEGGSVARAQNPAGKNKAKAVKAKLEATNKKISKIPIAGSRVQARANDELKKLLELLPPEVEDLGKRLKVSGLKVAHLFNPARMTPPWPVLFGVRSTPNEEYHKKFGAELDKQLKDAQAELNGLTVDKWVARADTFKSQHLEYFLKLDRNARAAAAAEIRLRLDETEPTADQEITQLSIAQKNLDDFIEKHGDGDLSYVQEKYRRRLEFDLEEAKQIGPAREALRAFLEKRPNSNTWSLKERAKFARLATAAKLT